MKVKYYFLALLLSTQIATVAAQQATYDNAQAERALEALAQTIKSNPSNVRAYKTRANIYFAMKQDDLALADLDKVVSLNPNDENSYIDRAVIHFAMKDYNLAMKDIKKALEINPDSAVAQEVHDKILYELREREELETKPKKKVNYHKSLG